MSSTVPGGEHAANIDREVSSSPSINLAVNGTNVTAARRRALSAVQTAPKAVAVAILESCPAGDGCPKRWRWSLTDLADGYLGEIPAGPADLETVAARLREAAVCDLAYPAADGRSVTGYRSSTFDLRAVRAWRVAPPSPTRTELDLRPCAPLPVADHAEWAARVVESCAAEAADLSLAATICGALQAVIHAAATATTEIERLTEITRAAAICDAYDEHAAARIGVRQPNTGPVTEWDGRDRPNRRRVPQGGTGAPAGISSPVGLEGARPGHDSGATLQGAAVGGGHTTGRPVVVLGRRGATSAAAHTNARGGDAS